MLNQFTVSLWGDEGFSAILSMKSLPDIIKIISHDTSPPLWNIFEWLVFKTLGTEEIYIRGLAFLFYLGAAFFVYQIAATLFSKKTGIIAVLLTLINPFFFIYAFEGRMYSILALGVTASMYFYIKLFFSEANKFTKIGYVFFSLWALYSHHFAIFALFLQGVWWIYELLFGRRVTAKKVFKLFLFIGLGYLPWLYPLYTQTKMVGGGFWLGKPTFIDLKLVIYDFLAQGIRNESLKLPVLNTAVYSIALYLVYAVLIIRKWWKNIKKSAFLLMWFLGPILLTFFVSQKFQSIFYNRYLLYTIPAAGIILASLRSKFSIFIITLLIACFGVIDFDYFTHPTKLPFREMASYVKEYRQPGDFLINWYSNGTHHIWETKYYNIPAPIYVSGDTNLPFFVGTALMENGDIIRDIPQNTKRVGVVTSGPIEEVELPGYTKIDSKEINGLKTIWYAK